MKFAFKLAVTTIVPVVFTYSIAAVAAIKLYERYVQGLAR